MPGPRSEFSVDYNRDAYQNFMTEKEKDFVAFLFERANRKQERVSPDFYTQRQVALPEQKQKEAGEKRVFEGVLGKATRKSTKKIDPESRKAKPFIIKKKILSRTNIEQIYNVLNKQAIFVETDGGGLPAEDLEEICARLKEIGEDLFSTDKGIAMVRQLLAAPGQERTAYEPVIVGILLERSKYILPSSEFCQLLSEMIPAITRYLSQADTDPAVLADRFISNASGVLIGQVVLLVLQKERPAQGKQVGAAIYQLLLQGRRQWLFSKVAHHLVWALLSLVVKEINPEQAGHLIKSLDHEIKKGMQDRKGPTSKNIHLCLKNCPKK